MSMPRVFGIYGDTDSGKTSLIVQLISALIKEGYRVATIKQTKKEISMDTKNKDTWRHRNAGALLVVFSSLCETDFLFSKAMPSSEIIEKISWFGDYDLILVEGADEKAIPKIQLGTGKKRSNTIASYRGNVKEILTLLRTGMKEEAPLQRLRIVVNGKDIPLTDFPEHFIYQTIVGMLSSLKGVQNIREFTIEMK